MLLYIIEWIGLHEHWDDDVNIEQFITCIII